MRNITNEKYKSFIEVNPNLTKILHYVSSINQKDDFVWVTFQEIISPGSMANYLEDAVKSWKEQGMPGEIPQRTIDQLREQRFKNEFQMKFPFPQWAKRDLRIHDKVEINMPLQLKDIVSVGIDDGI